MMHNDYFKDEKTATDAGLKATLILAAYYLAIGAAIGGSITALATLIFT